MSQPDSTPDTVQMMISKSISAPWGQQERENAKRWDRNNGKPISDRLDVLCVSNDVHEEGLKILFKESVFRYVIASPGKDVTPLETRNQMQNLEITLNVSFPFRDFPEKVLATGISILGNFQGSDVRRKKISIEILHRREYDLLVREDFVDALCGLSGFEVVELRLGNVVRRERTEDDGDMPALVVENDEVCVEVYRGLCAMLEIELGGAVGVVKGGKWFEMVFCPRRFVEGRGVDLME